MTETKTKSPLDAANTAYASIVKSLADLQDKFEIPEAAREFVKQSTATAQVRAADLHAGATKVAGAIEGALITTVTGVAELNRKLFELAHQDTEAALAAIDKLAGAKSLAEAYQLQIDYVRERGEVAVARAKDAAELVRAKVADGVKTVQDGIAKVMPVSQAA